MFVCLYVRASISADIQTVTTKPVATKNCMDTMSPHCRGCIRFARRRGHWLGSVDSLFKFPDFYQYLRTGQKDMHFKFGKQVDDDIKVMSGG